MQSWLVYINAASDTVTQCWQVKNDINHKAAGNEFNWAYLAQSGPPPNDSDSQIQ